MSKESYARGFVKAAQSAGVDPVHLAKYAGAADYVDYLRDFVSKDEIDDNLARRYGEILNKNNRLFEDEYERYEPRHHHFNWFGRPKTVHVQKLLHAFKKVADRLPEDKKDDFLRVAEKLAKKINEETSAFAFFPSYSYTSDDGGLNQYGFMAF